MIHGPASGRKRKEAGRRPPPVNAMPTTSTNGEVARERSRRGPSPAPAGPGPWGRTVRHGTPAPGRRSSRAPPPAVLRAVSPARRGPAGTRRALPLGRLGDRPPSDRLAPGDRLAGRGGTGHGGGAGGRG